MEPQDYEDEQYQEDYDTWDDSFDDDDFDYAVLSDCPYCSGEGEDDDGFTCRMCNGTGWW